MAKLTQAEIKTKADEIARIEGKVKKIESDRGIELDPFIRKHEAATKSINAKYDAKVVKLQEKRDELLGEVIGWLESHGKPIALEGEIAVAANELVIGKRTINPVTFFEKVKARTADFWDCVSIGIAKAEKLIGASAVNEISAKEKKLVASVKLK